MRVYIVCRTEGIFLCGSLEFIVCNNLAVLAGRCCHWKSEEHFKRERLPVRWGRAVDINERHSVIVSLASDYLLEINSFFMKQPVI